MSANTTFPALLEAFFTGRLVQQKHASAHTLASYRDTFCLLLRHAEQRLHKAPSGLALEDLDAPLVSAFLEHLQENRGTSARSRNVRLAAIHSFFRYAALEAPDHSGLIQRVLAIPSKRYERSPIAYLTEPEIEALLAAPDLSTWLGRRDRTLLLVALQTGLRVSELTGLRWQDVSLDTGAHVCCQGKTREPLHALAQRRHQRAACLAARATAGSIGTAVSHRARAAAEPRRGRLCRGETCCKRPSAVSFPGRETDITPCAAPLFRVPDYYQVI
jgi:site-specific recombinase XerD